MGQSSSTQNVAVLAGTVTSEPTRRSLPSGVDVVNFDLSTPVDGQRVSVPLAWHDPSASAMSSFDVGEEVVVVGIVRRRFFRSGGRTQSRTEVVVDSLVPARRAKSARSLRAAAAERVRPADE
ncbi:single-stranded DNA-binding protein [Ilumatobacter nonamiensis]|uniref:single-stranded DNA-binding protein n=1 Tax=Ilumatobacter nonamiensis TaxID=467093 RepID=UPI00130E5969|nr:single-stranded DNA-binding protein [Ilumatobacter nonamiensis]